MNSSILSIIYIRFRKFQGIFVKFGNTLYKCPCCFPFSERICEIPTKSHPKVKIKLTKLLEKRFFETFIFKIIAKKSDAFLLEC